MWTDSDEERKYITVYNHTVFITTKFLRRPLISNENSWRSYSCLAEANFFDCHGIPRFPTVLKTAHQWTLSRIQPAPPRSLTFISILSSQLHARTVSQTASSFQICRFKFCAHFQFHRTCWFSLITQSGW